MVSRHARRANTGEVRAIHRTRRGGRAILGHEAGQVGTGQEAFRSDPAATVVKEASDGGSSIALDLADAMQDLVLFATDNLQAISESWVIMDFHDNEILHDSRMVTTILLTRSEAEAFPQVRRPNLYARPV
jgi:hypothetical protein